jgi:hypothetical protein
MPHTFPRPALSIALVLAFAALALSGCAQAPAAASPTTAAQQAAAPTPITKTLQVSNPVATPGAVSTGPAAEPTSTEKADVEVPAGYTRMKAELKVSCSGPCGYGLLHARDGEASEFEATGIVDLRVTAGTYHLAARSTGPGAQMTGTITVVLT